MDWLMKPDIDKYWEDIKHYIDSCEKQRNEAIKELACWNKDEEIQKLKEEIERLKAKPKKIGLCFEINAEELGEINKWIDKHIEEKHNGSHYAGAIGGRFSYRFVPTSIGEIGEVFCTCGDSFCFRELN